MMLGQLDLDGQKTESQPKPHSLCKNELVTDLYKKHETFRQKYRRKSLGT